MDRRDKKKQSPLAKVAILLVVLLLSNAELFGTLLGVAIIIALLASPFVILYFVLKKKNGSAPKRKDVPFDDCPKPFCLHSDKGEHHLRKGKEIDPWDRPDIDISKYQRNR